MTFSQAALSSVVLINKKERRQRDEASVNITDAAIRNNNMIIL